MNWKGFFYGVVAVLVSLLSGCGDTHHTYPRKLVLADSLAEVWPDSAFVLLEQMAVQTEAADEADSMYQQLLKLKVGVLLKRSLPDSLTVRSLVEYYENKGDSRLLPEACYYAGCYYHLSGNMSQTLDYLLKALPLAERAGEDSSLLGRCTYMLGYIYNEQQLDKEAVSMLDRSLQIYQNLCDTPRMVYTSIELAWAHEGSGSERRAVADLRRAYRLSVCMRDTDMIGEVACQLARIYHAAKDEAQARRYLSVATDCSRPDHAPTLYSIAGRLYADWGERDSVKACCQRLLEVGGLDGRRTACKLLSEYYRGHDEAKSREYLLQYGAMTDTLEAVSAAEHVTLADHRYRYQTLEQTDGRKGWLWAGAVTVVVLLAVLLLWLFGAFKRLSRNNQTTIQSVKNLLSEERQEHEQERQRIQNLERSVEELKDTPRQTALRQIKATPVYRQLLVQIEERRAMTDEQIRDFRTVVLHAFPLFEAELGGFKSMNEFESLLCLLLKADFSFSEISALTSRTMSGVYSASSRLYLKNFGHPGKPKDWKAVVLKQDAAKARARRFTSPSGC